MRRIAAIDKLAEDYPHWSDHIAEPWTLDDEESTTSPKVYE